jgi:hypothetical protein
MSVPLYSADGDKRPEQPETGSVNGAGTFSTSRMVASYLAVAQTNRSFGVSESQLTWTLRHSVAGASDGWNTLAAQCSASVS